MFDAHGAWTPMYAIEFCRRAESYNLTWLEEPLRSESIAGYRSVRRGTRIPLAVGEHLYTRFEVANYLRDRLVDCLQPDVAWCGGITETSKICALASAADVSIVFHGASLIPAVHMALALPTRFIPMVEYHLTLEPKRQFFLSQQLHPVRGRLTTAPGPGLGMQLDPRRVETTSFLRLDDDSLVRQVAEGALVR